MAVRIGDTSRARCLPLGAKKSKTGQHSQTVFTWKQIARLMKNLDLEPVHCIGVHRSIGDYAGLG